MAKRRCLIFTGPEGQDVTSGLELRNGKSNISGWSTHDIYVDGSRIGRLYCGFPQDLLPGWTYREEEREV